MSLFLKATESFNPKKPTATPPPAPKLLGFVVGESLFSSCPICMMTRYYGGVCQEAAWKEYKKLCAGLKEKRRKRKEGGK